MIESYNAQSKRNPSKFKEIKQKMEKIRTNKKEWDNESSFPPGGQYNLKRGPV